MRVYQPAADIWKEVKFSSDRKNAFKPRHFDFSFLQIRNFKVHHYNLGVFFNLILVYFILDIINSIQFFVQKLGFTNLLISILLLLAKIMELAHLKDVHLSFDFAVDKSITDKRQNIFSGFIRYSF